jgi:hypothetical protein
MYKVNCHVQSDDSGNEKVRISLTRSVKPISKQMTYPELKKSPEDQPADSNPNAESKDYPHGGSSSTVEEAQLHYMNGDDPARMRNEPLFQYKKK